MYQMRTNLYDLVIKGGLLFTGEADEPQVTDIGVTGGKIARLGAVDEADGKTVVHAEGCVVTPGLIDYHTHINHGGDWASLPAEIYALPSGITTVVDAGSAGIGGYELFRQNTVCRSLLGVKAFLFIASSGQVHLGCVEDENPDHINETAIVELCEKYPGEIVGIKLKIDRDHLADYGLEPLRCAVRLGERTGLRVSAHATDPVASIEEILSILRPGDIYCHVYHDTGEGILDGTGKVRDCVLRARERGVLFDAAHGKTTNFSLEVARKAIEQGFLPDIISSDFTKISLAARYPFQVMLSEYLQLGMSLGQIIQRCTVEPAKLLGETVLPLIRPGQPADLAVFRVEDRAVDFWDHYGTTIKGDKLIDTKLTVKDGVILYDQMEDRLHHHK